jgi:PAP2 superfamily
MYAMPGKLKTTFNMKKIFIHFQILIIGIVLFSCSQKSQIKINDADVIHANVNKLTEIIIYDVFTPPVAARIYAYTSLAAYEAIRHSTPGSESIAEKLHGFDPLPQPEKDKKYNFTLAATKAFCTVAFNVRIFSDTVLHKYEDSIVNVFKESIPQDEYDRSIEFGNNIGNAILKRAGGDMYKETRGMSKYLGSDADGKWQPTPPDYFDGIEPYYRLIKPFSLDTSSQFRPLPPPAFSKDTNSVFYKMVKEVYTVSENLSEEQKTIASYWDDNPFVMQHSGHLMFANKKITPGGHWMGIAAIACRKTNADAVKTAQAFSLTSIALLDAFISCWDAKYFYEYVRPITLINGWMNREWNSFLQTPPFPEYTSGHSTISGASSEVLTSLFGDNFAFHDNSDSAYIGMTRDFSSFRQAAAEASVSRLYGGIHYRLSLDTGIAHGAMVGKNLLVKTGLSK